MGEKLSALVKRKRRVMKIKRLCVCTTSQLGSSGHVVSALPRRVSWQNCSGCEPSWVIDVVKRRGHGLDYALSKRKIVKEMAP